MTSRKQFEESLLAKLTASEGRTKEEASMYLLRDEGGEYLSVRSKYAWWGWQASRAAQQEEHP